MTAFASKEEMETTLKRSFELMEHDARFCEATQKTQLGIGFEIDDLGITFVVSIHHGQVIGELGASPDEADVQLSLSSDSYDRMFTGNLGPTRAALFGQLAISGDIPKARKLQGLLPDMIRLYKKAKAG